MKFEPTNESVYDFNESEIYIAEAIEVKTSSSDDEGVFDLDLDEDDNANHSNVSRPISRPTKGRFTRLVEEEQAQRVKQKFLHITQSKLKTVCRGQDSLRNKVLLESALKRCLTQSSEEKKNKLHVNSSEMSNSVHHKNVDITSNHSQRASHISKSAPSSPRKRSARDSSSSISAELDWTVAIKKMKALQYEDMDTSCDVEEPTVKDELFTDLASVFYRLKTQY